MARRKDPLHQARVAAVHLSPEELARAVRRKDEFAALTRELLRFVHSDPRLRDELEAARAHFFADYASPPDDVADHEGRSARGRFLEWFIYERTSRCRRERPLDSFIGNLRPGDRRRFAESLRDNVLDTFAVRAVAPGLGLTLESLANSRIFDVVERAGSQGLEPGAVLLGRVFPLGDRLWTISGVIYAIPDTDAAGVYTKTYARMKPEARTMKSQRDLEAVLASRHAPRRVDLSRRPDEPAAEEVESIVTALLAEAGIAADVAALRRRMAAAASPIGVVEELMRGGRFTNEEHLQETMAALMALWNTTPRPELGGRSPDEMREHHPPGPQELRLMSELIEMLESEGFPARFKTASRRKAAIAARQREWLGTPRDDLGGRTPGEVIAAERRERGRTPEAAERPPATVEAVAVPDAVTDEGRAMPDAAQLRRLPVTPGEWLGGRFATRLRIREPRPHSPEVIVWLELPSGLIVGVELVAPGDPAGRLDRTLVAAMQAPAAGAPRRPRRVRVADAGQVRELDALQGLVAVEAGATPELADIVAAMEADLGGGPAPGRREGGRIAPAGGGVGGWPAKTGRNDPCPCGSGRKYKHCHLGREV